ncbi:MAG TPA: phage tail protein, partial [Bryobacteraceae bacterium]|nr:phage tail protein [Bryobacteraceae bacterium]
MATIHEIKQQEITQTPIVLFDCELVSGQLERWSTHAVTFEGNAYAARVLGHNAFELRAGSEDGIDTSARIGIVLANADSHFSQIERTTGFKGARTAVRFVFFDLKQGAPASEAAVLFRGVADAPEEITETTFRLSVGSTLNLQRVLLPDVRIQKRCPWTFPKSAAQRAEGADGGTEGKHSRFWRCGYSPSEEDGAGSTDAGAPFTSCDGTRAQCEARGMFSVDALDRDTRRFGGIQYVPPSIAVRSYGERGSHATSTVESEARYNDFVPLVYGTAWYAPPIVFARNDGNLTRMEVLLAAGEIQSVVKVVVNGIEIPVGRTGKDMTGTGWHSVVTYGNRKGAFNTDFTDGAGNALGDPYGSMAMMSVVVPNRISEGRSLPDIEVLVEGMRLPQYDAAGRLVLETFTNNPAWVLLDVLRRCGWRLDEIDLASFARTSYHCDEPIAAEDLHGNTIALPRFQCNLVLRKRKSAAEVIRGIRTGSRLYLTYSNDGRLQLRAEGSIAAEQPVKTAATNSIEPLDGGWPAYEFGDGSNGFSGIVRRSSGEPSLRIWRRSTVETPNRFTLEFQDALNEYQQDSVSVTDEDDTLRTSQEISAGERALGVANWHQGARVVRLALNKSIAGNMYVEFETSVRAIGLSPGGIITVTYLKEGLQRQPFRIVKIQPGLNYRTATITAQIHDDGWYGDAIEGGNPGGARGGRRRTGAPRPLFGTVIDEHGDVQ